MRPEGPLAGGRAEELLRLCNRELVGREVLGHARALLAALDVWAVAADTQDDPVPDRKRVHRTCVDLAEVGHEILQALDPVATAEVEALQPLEPLLVARCDAVEVVLHAGGEVVVDELAEVLLEERNDGEGEERGNERRAALEDVAAVEDRAHDRRVRGGAADAALLERLHEAGLGVARRRRGRVARRLELERLNRVPVLEVRQGPLVLRVGGSVVVAALLIRGEEAAEGDHGARGGELGVAAAARARAEPERHGEPARICHLRGDASASRSARRARAGRG